MLLTQESEYDIRYSTPEDYPYLHGWLGEMRKWYPISSDRDVEAMAKNWIGFYRYGACLTAVYQSQPVGIATLFLLPYRKVMHHCVVYFIVHPQLQRKGIGRSLVKNINHLGENYFRFEWLNMEVFEGCPAIPVIEKEGYEQIYCQKRFVKENGEYSARFFYQVNFKRSSQIQTGQIQTGQIQTGQIQTGPIQTGQTQKDQIKHETSSKPNIHPLITFRQTELKDFAYYKEWLEQKGVLEGFPMSDTREINDAIRLWSSYLDKGTSITALDHGHPVGTSNLYVSDVEKLHHQCLFVILVDEKYRGLGIGTLLLKEIQHLAKHRFHIEVLHLEVYDKNPAIRLYKRMGFRPYAQHLNYLKDQNGIYYTKISMEMEL